MIDELARRADEADKFIDKAQRATQKALANPIRVKVATLPTFTRYVFDLKTKTHVDPERGEGTYTLHFDQPIKWDLGDALSALPATVHMIDTSHTANTASVRFKLKRRPAGEHLPRRPQLRHRYRSCRRFRATGAGRRRGGTGGARPGHADDHAAGDRAG